MTTKMNARGGPRTGAGRPKKYDEPTVQVGFKIPASHVDEVKKKVLRILKKLERHV